MRTTERTQQTVKKTHYIQNHIRRMESKHIHTYMKKGQQINFNNIYFFNWMKFVEINVIKKVQIQFIIIHITPNDRNIDIFE